MSKKKSAAIGTSLDDLLHADGILEEVTAEASKRVLAFTVRRAMGEAGLDEQGMVKAMNTSRAAVDRLLDSGYTGMTLKTLIKAAQATGKRLRITVA